MWCIFFFRLLYSPYFRTAKLIYYSTIKSISEAIHTASVTFKQHAGNGSRSIGIDVSILIKLKEILLKTMQNYIVSSQRKSAPTIYKTLISFYRDHQNTPPSPNSILSAPVARQRTSSTTHSSSGPSLMQPSGVIVNSSSQVLKPTNGCF